MKRSHHRTLLAAAAAIVATTSSAPSAQAHCDALDGPVVSAAREALRTGTPTPVLRWVLPAQEAAVRKAFAETLSVRRLSGKARSLADRYFFETVVRLHRQGEGAPYTGLKPAGHMDPVLTRADRTLESGSVDSLATTLARQVEAGVRQRFDQARKARARADDSVEAGRELVRKYVAFVHYIQQLHRVVKGAGHDHSDAR